MELVELSDGQKLRERLSPPLHLQRVWYGTSISRTLSMEFSRSTIVRVLFQVLVKSA